MNIYEKISAIMSDVQYLAKDDRVKYKTTDYAALSEEKVTGIMREKMIAQKLIVYPIEMQTSRTGAISHVDVKYRIQNVEAPDEYIDVVSCGDGADTQDKGAGKAMTYAFKYMWLRTFAIPTGEDPDKISSEELDAKERAASEKEKSITSEKSDKVTSYTACQGCKKEIKSVTIKGKEYSAANIIKVSQKEFGKNLCYDCIQYERKRKAAKDKLNAN